MREIETHYLRMGKTACGRVWGPSLQTSLDCSEVTCGECAYAFNLRPNFLIVTKGCKDSFVKRVQYWKQLGYSERFNSLRMGEKVLYCVLEK